jgi:hypothetical protein
MSKIKEAETDYKQIKKMIKQLDFEKKVTLIKEIVFESEYRKGFYKYTEGLAVKYRIPKMSEETLDEFLHK